MQKVGFLRLLTGMIRPCLWLALLCFAFFTAAGSIPAYAHDFDDVTYLFDTTTNESCPGPNCNDVLGSSKVHKVVACPGNGLARRIIPCVRSVILKGTNDFLIPFSAYIASTVQVCCILAVILWAVQMISGSDTAPLKDSMVMAVKIGCVVTFTNNFGGNSLDPGDHHGGNFGLVLDIMEEMVTIVSGYVINASQFGLEGDCPKFADTDKIYLVWDAVDCAVNTLVGGIFSPLSITAGIIGFLTACLFSNTIGFTIGTAGLYLIYKLLYAIFKCCYIFLTAYMGIAFMVVISPLFIPTILFKSTKTYFDKWLRLFISYIIQPMVLFAYLAMLLCAFDVTVFSNKNKNSLYYAIAGHDPCFYVAADTGCGTGNGFGGKLGTWIMTNGFYTNVDKAGQAMAIDSKAIKNAGLMPKDADELGAAGKVTQQMLTYLATKQKGTIGSMGTDGKKPNFFQIDIPEKTVDWTKLARANQFDDSTPALSTTSYILKILVAAFMALLTGYIFSEMLDVIPFIGSGLAMGGGGIMDGKLSSVGMGEMNISASKADFTKNLKFGADKNKGAGSL